MHVPVTTGNRYAPRVRGSGKAYMKPTPMRVVASSSTAHDACWGPVSAPGSGHTPRCWHSVATGRMPTGKSRHPVGSGGRGAAGQGGRGGGKEVDGRWHMHRSHDRAQTSGRKKKRPQEKEQKNMQALHVPMASKPVPTHTNVTGRPKRRTAGMNRNTWRRDMGMGSRVLGCGGGSGGEDAAGGFTVCLEEPCRGGCQMGTGAQWQIHCMRNCRASSLVSLREGSGGGKGWLWLCGRRRTRPPSCTTTIPPFA